VRWSEIIPTTFFVSKVVNQNEIDQAEKLVGNPLKKFR